MLYSINNQDQTNHEIKYRNDNYARIKHAQPRITSKSENDGYVITSVPTNGLLFL